MHTPCFCLRCVPLCNGCDSCDLGEVEDALDGRKICFILTIPNQMQSGSPVSQAPELCFYKLDLLEIPGPVLNELTDCSLYLRHLAKSFTYIESFNFYIYFC